MESDNFFVAEIGVRTRFRSWFLCGFFSLFRSFQYIQSHLENIYYFLLFGVCALALLRIRNFDIGML